MSTSQTTREGICILQKRLPSSMCATLYSNKLICLLDQFSSFSYFVSYLINSQIMSNSIVHFYSLRGFLCYILMSKYFAIKGSNFISCVLYQAVVVLNLGARITTFSREILREYRFDISIKFFHALIFYR